MSDYDFRNLHDKEFEALSIDLLSRHLGCQIGRFKPGPDGGVDGRFFASDGGEVIIQCKHWIKSGLQPLMRAIEKTEAEKVKKLKPARYIFVTSLELSRENKKKIKELFSPYIRTEEDIFGKEDLNDILSENEKIERKHHKLWIPSSNVFQAMLNSAIIGRSEHKLREIAEESRRYVITQNYEKAKDKLEKWHSVIITGLPGVGKTTLADQLCQYYVANDYELCFIEDSLNQAEGIYNKESKQIFYFDDFLGRNSLLALDFRQDSKITNFIKRVERDEKKRFILTSRTSILNQGKDLTDLFDIRGIDQSEHEISILSLTDIDKARILYNHIWFSDLGEEYTDEIYKEKRYLEIVRHRGFNPRLISFITSARRFSDISADKYWEHIKQTLSNPKDIWRHVFRSQIDSFCGHITIAAVLHGRSLSESEFINLCAEIKLSKLVNNENRDHETIVKLLVGTLINRSLDKDNKASYELFNPSIADFVIANYLSDFDYIDTLLMCLRTPHSILHLNSLVSSGKIKSKFYRRLLESQLIKLSKEEDSKDIDGYKLGILYHIQSSSMAISDDVFDYMKYLSKQMLRHDPSSYGIDYFKFIDWSLSLGIIDEKDPVFMENLERWILEYDKEEKDFILISKIVAALERAPWHLTDDLKEQYVKYLSEDITIHIMDERILDEVYDRDSYDPREVEIYVEERFSALAIDFGRSDVDSVVGCCDIDHIIEENLYAASLNNEQPEKPDDQKHDARSSTDIINDLFDRS